MSPRRVEFGVSKVAERVVVADGLSSVAARLREPVIPAAAKAEDCLRNFRREDGMRNSFMFAPPEDYARSLGAGWVIARFVPCEKSAGAAFSGRLPALGPTHALRFAAGT